MGEIIRKAHTHTHTHRRIYLQMLELWRYECTVPQRKQKTTRTVNYVKHDFSFSITFISIILLLQHFPSALQLVVFCLESEKEREGLMHFVEYFECTLLLRMYTNGVALAALLAYSFNSTQFTSCIRFSSHCAKYIQRQHHRWRAIIQCVPFDLNSCTFRPMHRTSARLLQTASENHKTTSRTLSHRPD